MTYIPKWLQELWDETEWLTEAAEKNKKLQPRTKPRSKVPHLLPNRRQKPQFNYK